MFTYVRTDRGIAVELPAVDGGVQLVHLVGYPQEGSCVGSAYGVKKLDGLFRGSSDLSFGEDGMADRALLKRPRKKLLSPLGL